MDSENPGDGLPDLFSAQNPSYDGYLKPQPWFGCDTSSEAWRRYCEAWSVIHRVNGLRHVGYSISVKKFRGKTGVDILERTLKIVGDDIKGLIVNRADLEKMLAFKP